MPSHDSKAGSVAKARLARASERADTLDSNSGSIASKEAQEEAQKEAAAKKAAAEKAAAKKAAAEKAAAAMKKATAETAAAEKAAVEQAAAEKAAAWKAAAEKAAAEFTFAPPGVITWKPDHYSATGKNVTGRADDRPNQSLFRLACYENGQCLLVRDSDLCYGPPSCCSGGYDWGACDTIDVALGTYAMNADGNKVECNWTKHFQRKLSETGNECWDEVKLSDSGWTEMVETASWKWKHFDLSMRHVGGDESDEGKWEMEHGSLVTGGSHILGIPIIKNTSYPDGTQPGAFGGLDLVKNLEASNPADDVLGLLGVPPDSTIRMPIAK